MRCSLLLRRERTYLSGADAWFVVDHSGPMGQDRNSCIHLRYSGQKATYRQKAPPGGGAFFFRRCRDRRRYGVVPPAGGVDGLAWPPPTGGWPPPSTVSK